jgi:hypothetical protein
MFACKGRLFCGMCGEILIMPFEGVMDHFAHHWFKGEIGNGDPHETLDFMMMPATVELGDKLKELPAGFLGDTNIKLADAKSWVIKPT